MNGEGVSGMGCNKDEAIRAKEIAKKKMQGKEFPAARKMLQKAQQLYSELENVQQMVMVCDVHCAATEIQIKSSKDKLIDWYGILQIEQTADEATIKKQYRKFALQLHPDKNKFPGAEAAFKLIGEAQRVLVDHAKRSAFDIKRRTALGGPAYQPVWKQSSFSHGVGRGTVSFTGVNLQQPKQWPSHQGFSSARSTFWTKCPYCGVRYQYYIDVRHRTLNCQNCTKKFTAYDSGSILQPSNLNQPKVSQQRDVQNLEASKVKRGSPGNSGFQNSKVPYPSRGSGSVEAGAKKVSAKQGSKLSVDSSDSVGSESSRETEGDVSVDRKGGNDNPSGNNSEPLGEQNLRRSGRCKQEVSYKENLSDDDDSSIPSKRAKMSGSSSATEVTGDRIRRESHSVSDTQDDRKEEHRKCGVSCENVEVVTGCSEGIAEENDLKRTSETGARAAKGASNADTTEMDDGHTIETTVYEYPDPEFNDFDKDKKEDRFNAGQIWAIYDTVDAMPRFYARIRKVIGPGFKLRITWLEPNPDFVDESEWANEGFPTSCGNFIHGHTEVTEDHPMFSHMMLWEGGKLRNSFRVLPRKGETWALFKNWDMNWKSDALAHKKYEYEFVEILSEYAEGVGTDVACLAKLKGFISVFCRVTDNFQIPPCELFRFSHRVPSYVLSGQEREGLPKGSFELDPAALPFKLEEISLPEGFTAELDNGYVSRSSSSKKQTPIAEQVDPAPKGRRKVVLDLDDDTL